MTKAEYTPSTPCDFCKGHDTAKGDITQDCLNCDGLANHSYTPSLSPKTATSS